jgi:hypothetical protein
VLLPTYCTVPTHLTEWDKYTLMNVLAGSDEGPKYRLWVTAIFGYVYAAYFCQLLFTEYHNFSLQRLHYLAQVRSNMQYVMRMVKIVGIIILYTHVSLN